MTNQEDNQQHGTEQKQSKSIPTYQKTNISFAENIQVNGEQMNQLSNDESQKNEDIFNTQTLQKAKKNEQEQQQDLIQTLQNQENAQTDLLQKGQDASIMDTLQKANKNEKQQTMETNIPQNLQLQNMGASNQETLKKAKKNEKQQIELELPKQDLIQIKQQTSYGKNKQKIIVDKAAVLEEIFQEQQKYQMQQQEITDNCSDKPFLLSSNEKNDESFMKFAALEVFQRANKLREANERQGRPIIEWQDKIFEIGVPLVYSGTTIQQELARIPNLIATKCGNAMHIQKKMMEEAKASRKQTVSKFVCSDNQKVQSIQKMALFSSKFVRPYLQDSTQAPQPTSKIELISSQIPMTTTLRAIMSNSFSIECLKQSRLDYMRPMLKMITIQFGLLDQKLEKKLMTFFCFCYSYFMGGAAEAVNDLLIFKKIQQHHRFSTKIINPPPKLTPETKAEVEDYLIRLINTPEVSLYSLGEDLGVGRIINYCSICGLMGMIPITLEPENETNVDQTLQNMIIKSEENKFYQEKQSFRFLFSETQPDPEPQEIDFDLMWSYETTQKFKSPQINNEQRLRGPNVKFSAVFEEAHKIKNEITSVGELRKAYDSKRENECEQAQTIHADMCRINTIAIPTVKQMDLRTQLLEKKKFFLSKLVQLNKKFENNLQIYQNNLSEIFQKKENITNQQIHFAEIKKKFLNVTKDYVVSKRIMILKQFEISKMKFNVLKQESFGVQYQQLQEKELKLQKLYESKPKQLKPQIILDLKVCKQQTKVFVSRLQYILQQCTKIQVVKEGNITKQIQKLFNVCESVALRANSQIKTVTKLEQRIITVFQILVKKYCLHAYKGEFEMPQVDNYSKKKPTLSHSRIIFINKQIQLYKSQIQLKTDLLNLNSVLRKGQQLGQTLEQLVVSRAILGQICSKFAVMSNLKSIQLQVSSRLKNKQVKQLAIRLTQNCTLRIIEDALCSLDHSVFNFQVKEQVCTFEIDWRVAEEVAKGVGRSGLVCESVGVDEKKGSAGLFRGLAGLK